MDLQIILRRRKMANKTVDLSSLKNSAVHICEGTIAVFPHKGREEGLKL